MCRSGALRARRMRRAHSAAGATSAAPGGHLARPAGRDHARGVAIHWFTDADREDLRLGEAERRVLDELEGRACRERPESRAIPATPAMLRRVDLEVA